MYGLLQCHQAYTVEIVTPEWMNECLTTPQHENKSAIGCQNMAHQSRWGRHADTWNNNLFWINFVLNENERLYFETNFCCCSIVVFSFGCCCCLFVCLLFVCFLFFCFCLFLFLLIFPSRVKSVWVYRTKIYITIYQSLSARYGTYVHLRFKHAFLGALSCLFMTVN